jgi:hypothetical protein
MGERVTEVTSTSESLPIPLAFALEPETFSSSESKISMTSEGMILEVDLEVFVDASVLTLGSKVAVFDIFFLGELEALLTGPAMEGVWGGCSSSESRTSMTSGGNVLVLEGLGNGSVLTLVSEGAAFDNFFLGEPKAVLAASAFEGGWRGVTV